MRVTGKKTLLILCLTSILLITGVGLSLAAGGPDYGQVIGDLSGLLDKVVKLSPEQAEQAVGISGVLADELFKGGVLSDSEKTALENTLNITYSTYTETRSALEDYIADYTSGGKTGYAGLLNAINPDKPDTEYLFGLVQRLYNAVGPETRAQLGSKGIAFEELVSITAKWGQIQFGPGLEITDDVRQQIDDILQEIITKSDGKLTQEDLTACGLTVENITELYGKLTPEQKAQLEDILATMGLIAGGDQEKPQVTTYQPGKDALDVSLDAVVSATFDRDVTAVDLSGVKIDAGGSALAGTSASLEGRVLTISHPELQSETTYTVTIPAGSLQAGSVANDEIKWSFATLRESGDYKLTLDVHYDSVNNTVTASGSLTKRDEAQTPVRDVAIGLVIEKDGRQYAIAQGLTDGSGVFRKTFSTASFEPGTYTVTATANRLTGQGSFTIPTQGVVSPAVETNSATSITTSSATLNGNITNTGGENCDQRKFQYRKQGTTEWSDAGVESGSFGTGAFSFALTGLSSDTAYEAKAMAHNSAGWGEGLVVAFTTTYSSGGGGGGGGGGTSSKPEVDKYQPAKDAVDVALDAPVSVTFKQDIKAGDLTKVSIKDDKNKEVTGVKATISGKALTLAHDKFNYETKYTVTIPQGTIKREDNNTENDAITWSFTTLKKEVPPVPKCEFTDVPAGHWAAAYIKALCEKGIIAGYPDGTYKPGHNITRAEFAKIIVGAVGLSELKPAVPTFVDVPSTHWSYGYVEAAAKAGLVKGSGGKFRPNDYISRQEIAVILVRAMDKESEALAKAGQKTKFKDDAQIAAWAKGHVIVAVAEGLINGYPDNTFGSTKNATRAESAKMIYLFVEK